MISICPKVKQLATYKAGKPVSDLTRELGLKNIVKLASNERPTPISAKIEQAIIRGLSQVNRYPDNNGLVLKSALSKHLSTQEVSINDTKLILGNGSSNILELVAKACVCKASDEVIFSQYSFMLYALIAQALGATPICVPSQDYGHNLAKMLAAINTKTKLIFIANPNNPSGTFLTDKAIYSFMQAVPKRVIVVLDEAYVEYIENYHTLGFLAEFENLIITRTFSKAYGLAGLRVGYGIANPVLIDYLNRIRAPFNVNSLAQIAAIAALEDKITLLETIAINTKGLVQLMQGFEDLSLKYIPSKANFISIKVNNSTQVYQDLLKKGFIVRLIEIPDFIRISVGSKLENTGVIEALKQII